MHQLQEKQKYIPLKYIPRSIEYQCPESFIIRKNTANNIPVDEEEYGKNFNHTEEECEIVLKKTLPSNEPVGHPTFEYRHQQHQQQILKHSRHTVQRDSSRYTLTSQSHSESSSPSIVSTHFFHPIFSGWKPKPNKSATKLQPKPTTLSPTSLSRSYRWQFYHQNKNSAEKPAGKLLRWSSSNRGGSIAKKQFDREYRFLRNNNCIEWKQQQQRGKQIKHIELLFYHAFVKNTLTARKH
jgi:hypothetical protein